MDERAAVIAEARTWLGTPWHHAARVKRAGVDCGQLLAAIFEACGLIEPEEIAAYPKDFHLHSNEEMFLGYVERHFKHIDAPALPGDLALWRYGHVISHAGIVIEWPNVLHAYYVRGAVVEDDVTAVAELADPKRYQGLWRLRRWM
jgi:cell wall-associated NlpC family hydrolase